MSRIAKLRPSRALLGLTFLLLTACAGPRSEVEVFHLRDMVKEGRSEYLAELINALGSSSEEVRSAAVNSLAELGEVAEPRLKQTVREQSILSGPALRALGKAGNPESLGIIREYREHPSLGAPAQEAERAIERKLFTQVQAGDLEAMEAYLDAFPDSDRNDQIRRTRKARLAKNAYEQVARNPTPESLEAFLTEYPEAEDAPIARVTLSRLLIKDALGALELERFDGARTLLRRAVEVDARREVEVQRLMAQSYLNEGRKLKADNQEEAALKALEEASKHPEQRLEAERLRADILMSQGRARFQAGKIREGVELIEQAAALDPARRAESIGIKATLSSDYQARLTATDTATRRLALVGLLTLGDEAVKPMELYLGNLFLKKDYAKVDEVVVALSEVRRAAPSGARNPGADRVTEMLVEYLRTALVASSAEVTRLFSAPDFTALWKPSLNPLDPREYPLVFKVDELTSRHLGLSRIGLTAKALLGDSGVEVVKGSLLKEDELRQRITQGQLGQDPSLPLLTRVQLAARIASAYAELRRTAEKQPALFMEYAVGLMVPPVSAADWLSVSEGFKRLSNAVGAGQRLPTYQLGGGLRNDRTALVNLDFDQRSLTLQVTDPVVGQLAAGTPEVRSEASQRTLALLLNVARSAFSLYSSIERLTVMMGTAEVSGDTGQVVKGGRFDPETRMLLSQKNYVKLDWEKLRVLNGSYGPNEAAGIDLQWARWGK